MSAFHGPQGSGALKRHREQKRKEAEARNALTLPQNRKRYRRYLVALPTGGAA